MQRIMASDLEIAQKAQLEPIETIAWKLGIHSGELISHGQYMAKLTWDGMKQRFDSSKELILVTSVNPTPFGEGKTVTTIGLTQALCHIGKNATCVVREPSMGPVFGIKGGAAGGEVDLRFFRWKKSISTLQATFMLLHLHTIFSRP